MEQHGNGAATFFTRDVFLRRVIKPRFYMMLASNRLKSDPLNSSFVLSVYLIWTTNESLAPRTNMTMSDLIHY